MYTKNIYDQRKYRKEHLNHSCLISFDEESSCNQRTGKHHKLASLYMFYIFSFISGFSLSRTTHLRWYEYSIDDGLRKPCESGLPVVIVV